MNLCAVKVKDYIINKKKTLEARIKVETERDATATVAELKLELYVVELAIQGLKLNPFNDSIIITEQDFL
jgi:hypothetical protein